MKRSKDYALEELIQKSEEALKELEDIKEITEEVSDKFTERITSVVREKFIESEEEPIDFQIDGYAKITISEDEMKVMADFYPPSEGRKPIDLYEVEHLLQSKRVVLGIDWEAVKNAILKCNTEKAAVHNVLIANGAKPENEVPEYLVIEDGLLEKSQAIDLDSLRVDFKMTSPFIFVKEGEVLARLQPKQVGRQGSTVFGKAIPYRTEKIAKIEPGENTRWEGARVVAACDGRFENSRDSLWVNEVLQIETDIDYRTGHIFFPGDVIIKGQIKDGFKVNAGGSVFCNHTMDASEVSSGKDLTVKLGLIGRKKGKVKVGGELKAKFIENCYVEAKDSILVDVGILNSSIHTSNKVELGKKGVIVGGTIYAQNGVTATQIGTAMGPKTEIYCGTDYAVEQKLEWIRDKNVELAFRLKQVERKLKEKETGWERLLDVQEKIKQAIHKLNEAAYSLLFKLDRNEEAEVIVRGQVFPGVYIEICHTSYIVSHGMSNICFQLDKAKGRIIPEPLSLKERAV